MAQSAIVITSIFAPTEAVAKFAALTDYHLVVVGDKKSPAEWQHPNVTYLAVADQEAAGFRLTTRLPFNHYGRKMVGYLHAIRAGAQLIIDTDDDNIPYDDWAFPALSGTFATAPAGRGFVNLYKSFTAHHIWLLKHYHEPGLVNVGTGTDLSICELATLVQRTVGHTGTIRFNTDYPDGAFCKLMDVSKLADRGWTHSTVLAAGLRDVYEDFLRHKPKNMSSAASA